jgi:hypothetical protein
MLGTAVAVGSGMGVAEGMAVASGCGAEMGSVQAVRIRGKIKVKASNFTSRLDRFMGTSFFEKSIGQLYKQAAFAGDLRIEQFIQMKISRVRIISVETHLSSRSKVFRHTFGFSWAKPTKEQESIVKIFSTNYLQSISLG